MKDSSSIESESTGAGPHINGDLCRDLLGGYLLPAEREAVLTHIAGCQACERFFAERVLEREHLRASVGLRRHPSGKITVERLPQTTEPAEPEEGPLRVPQVERTSAGRPWTNLRDRLRRPQHGLALGLAAAAAIILMILWPHPQEIPGTVLLHWLPGGSSDLQIRATAETTENEELSAGFDAYVERDLGQAISRLQSAEASGQLEILRRIYLASALAWTGKHAEAVAVLRTVPADILPDPWGSEAQWTLFVALKESNQAAAADSLLRVLAGERGEIGERARSFEAE